MASPRDASSQNQIQPQSQSRAQSQPLTPPADAPSTTAPHPPSGPPPPSTLAQLPSHPATSLSDPGTTRRPRDARLIHLVLASLGVSAYQERVPLQLLDFAYRYTSSVLSDAVHIQAEGYDIADGSGSGTAGGGKGGAGAGRGIKSNAAGGNVYGTGAGGAGAGAAAEKEEVSLASLRIAIGSRMQYQYQGALPKEFLMGLAKERNRIGLGIGRSFGIQQQQRDGQTSGDNNTTAAAAQMVGGIRLPPEKYCLTGVGWGLRDEWDSEGEEEVFVPRYGGDSQNGVDGDVDVAGGAGGERDAENEGVAAADDGEDDEEMMEDIFGTDGGGDGGDSGGVTGPGPGAPEDEDMQDG